MRKQFSLFVLFLFLAPLINGAEITVEEFEAISRNTADVMRSYRGMIREVDTYRSLVWENIDVLQTFSEYTIDTSFGQTSAEISSFYDRLYLNFIKNEGLLLGIFGSAAVINLKGGVSVWNPEKDEYESYYWRKGNTAAGFRAVFSGGSSIAIGVLAKMIPYTEVDALGNTVFTAVPDEAWHKTLYFEYDLFLHGSIWLFDIGGLLNFSGENLFDNIELCAPLDISGLMKLSPYISYQRFLNTVRLGVSVERFMPFHFIALNAQFYYDINREIYGSSVAYSQLKMELYLAKNEETDPYSGTRDFFWKISGGVSYDREIFRDGILGTMWEISAENLVIEAEGKKCYFRTALGCSKNYHETYYRLPVEDELLIHLDLRMMLDDW